MGSKIKTMFLAALLIVQFAYEVLYCFSAYTLLHSDRTVPRCTSVWVMPAVCHSWESLGASLQET